jgi:regulator of sirC expression with transglutaminase-like and TPR domain
MISDLWDERDRADLDRLQAALRADALVDALFAVEGAPDEVEVPCRQRLRQWSRAVARHRPGPTGPEQAEVLRQVLCEGVGLRGETEAYYAPRTCHLSAVVQHLQGMPILVCAVWIAVAREAGLDAWGVGLPGHFIVRVGAEEAVLVDPFAGGEPLEEPDCRHLIGQTTGGRVAWDPNFLSSVDTRQIVLRVLRNLLNCAERTDDGALLYRTGRFLAELLPEDPQEQLRLAAVTEAVGATPTALDLYVRVARRFPGTAAAAHARTRWADLKDRAPTVH